MTPPDQVYGRLLDATSGRVALDLRSGRHIEGYLLEVVADGVTFGHGGPLAPPEDELLPFDELPRRGVSTWRGGWVDLAWDEASGAWLPEDPRS